MTKYCNNDPCETEAEWYFEKDSGERFYLCYTCMQAFEIGQVNAGKDTFSIWDIDDEDVDEVSEDFLQNKAIEEDPLNTLFAEDDEVQELDS